MHNRLTRNFLLSHAFCLVLGGLLVTIMVPGNVTAAESVMLNDIPHIHGFSAVSSEKDQLLLATHKGLFLASSKGGATRISDISDDLMGFASHPNDASIFYASGHPSTGGNLGVLKSTDGGKTWRKISDGASGPVDFHTMTISPVDPNVMFGAGKNLQVSNDGGISWTIAAETPGEVFDLAASAYDPNILYAATRKGLYRSDDTGKSWQPAYMILKPATMVDVTPEGKIRAFLFGVGLVVTEEADLKWRKQSNSFQDRFFWRIEQNPKNPNQLYALVDTGALLISKDNGKAWTSFENHQWVNKEVIDKGRALYEENCQDCHGEKGVGERPNDMFAKDDFGFVAPPLDDSAHGWHHSDQGIVETILNGSPRNERMIAWKDTLTPEDAQNIVTYIKSLWSFRSLACQGSRHMSCMN